MKYIYEISSDHNKCTGVPTTNIIKNQMKNQGKYNVSKTTTVTSTWLILRAIYIDKNDKYIIHERNDKRNK